jgi:alpha-L-rhamnosidase
MTRMRVSPRWGLAGVALALSCGSMAEAQTALRVKNLRCEYKVDPLGIDVRRPRLSWELESAEKNVVQTSYELQVAGSGEELGKGKVIWGSGEVKSDASVGVEYAGQALVSGRTYFWRVRVWDNLGHLSGWSDGTQEKSTGLKTRHYNGQDNPGAQPGAAVPQRETQMLGAAKWEMGLLESGDWKASWITPDVQEDETKSNPAPLLRREFQVKKKVQRARLYATAMGLYEMELNGKRVGDAYFTPGWTAYDFRYQYQTYDVTEMLKGGANCLGAMLGDGWFRSAMTWDKKRNSYGKKSQVLAQLVITYVDGTQEIVGSDGKWKAATGPVLESDIYDGETYDARLEKSWL